MIVILNKLVPVIPLIKLGRKKGTNDTKGTVKLINLKQTDNAMTKNEKKTNKQQHTRHNIEN